MSDITRHTDYPLAAIKRRVHPQFNLSHSLRDK
jgi:hypothetical protein